MEQTLATAISALSKLRPCFHSEADLQFALGWQLKVTNPDVAVRLEIPVPIGNKRYKLDLLYSTNGRRIAVELKYFKAPICVDHQGETFNLVDAGAQDINRYDFLKDVQRLEHILASGAADEGYAIVLTNQPKYWGSRPPGNRVDEAFSFGQGQLLIGQIAWAEHVGGTSKGREAPISLVGAYRLNWFEYSTFPEQRFGRFCMLAVQAVAGVPPTDEPQDVKFRIMSTGSVRPRYSELTKFLNLSGQCEVTMRFAEIESVVGKLPPSSRNHRAWWGNHAGNSQARWMDAGYMVRHIDTNIQVVVFGRVS